ncbi:MAG: serine/threonine protein phosphatase [Kordiimonadaceae bacterium]|nr:serine/threonine protein phosphatase [Kordiimonadaceae bacterium]
MIENIMLFFFAAFIAFSVSAQEIDQKFTIAVIPDTQNMVDYRHQPEEGYAVDGGAMFLEQMDYIADNSVTNGGEIEFVTSVGDVWDHVGLGIEQGHYDRGLRSLGILAQRDNSRNVKGIQDVELPLARKGYDKLKVGEMIFSVVPGNHDFDKTWFDSNFPRDLSRVDEISDEDGWYSYLDPTILGMLHYGGFNNFNSVFGDDSNYFANKNWYISSFNGGANSAQVFEAGGYKFLHFGFEMQAGDAVIAWAQSVIDDNPGLPTIITTHDFLNQHAERQAEINMDLTAVDPLGHKAAEDIWNDFITINDQIFMVLCGHYRGAAYRADKNDTGHDVYQMLSNYQGRGQSADPEPDIRPTGISDGWIRLMEFDMSGDVPIIKVRTYSTYYDKFSVEIPEYANWYKRWEHEDITDEEFNELDDFVIELTDFRERFGEN